MYNYNWDKVAVGCMEFLTEDDKFILNYGMIPLKFLDFITDRVIRHMCKRQKTEALDRYINEQTIGYDFMIINMDIDDLLTLVDNEIIRTVRSKLSVALMRAAQLNGILDA